MGCGSGLDVGLGLRRRRLRARLPENLRHEGGVLVGHSAARQQHDGASNHAHRDLGRRHGESGLGWQFKKAGLPPKAAFFVSGQLGRVGR